MDKCCTYSHKPTPPACGHTFRPYLAAINNTAKTSLTPPMRQASICTTSMASRMMNCLNMMRFWHISPVATCMGLIASRMARCASTSSGLVGSSINQGLANANSFTQAIASSRSQIWLASIIKLRSGPMMSRAICTRRLSSSKLRPTLSLM